MWPNYVFAFEVAHSCTISIYEVMNNISGAYIADSNKNDCHSPYGTSRK